MQIDEKIRLARLDYRAGNKEKYSPKDLIIENGKKTIYWSKEEYQELLKHMEEVGASFQEGNIYWNTVHKTNCLECNETKK